MTSSIKNCGNTTRQIITRMDSQLFKNTKTHTETTDRWNSRTSTRSDITPSLNHQEEAENRRPQITA